MWNVCVNSSWHYQNRTQLSLLLMFVFLFTGSPASAACIVENDDRIQINISPQNRSWADYLGQMSIPASKVVKCQEEAGKFLMFSLGSVQWGPSSESKDSYIFDSYEPGKCQLENSRSVSSYVPQVTRDNFQRQYKFIRSCIDLRVADTRGLPLVVKDQQEFCQVQRIDESAVLLRGSMCFVKIRAQNDFSVQPLLRSECTDPDYLKSLGIEAQDLFSNLDTLVVGDDTGVSTDVRHIGSRAFNVNITPKKGLLDLSDDFGEGVPRFPTTYNVEGDWGPVNIRTRENMTQFDLSFFVSNIGERRCLNGECSSSSNFTQPFTGQIELYKLSKNARPELIEEWWDGGLVPPNWQGFMSGMSFKVQDQIIKSGSRYRLIATFQDPTDDYAIFLNGLKQMLVRLYNTEGATVGIDNLPAIQTLGELGVVPTFGGLSGLRENNQTVNLSETLAGLEGIISSTTWPPYYGKICSEKAKCQKLGNRKFHQKLILEFTAILPDPSGGRVILQDIKMQKMSPVFREYPLQSGEFISLQCER